MIVTELTELSKTKAKVSLDNGETFALYKSELRAYHIGEGKELSEELYDTIVKEVLSKRAKLRCMNLLKSRDYTEYQLSSKLKQGLYPETVIHQALEYVKSYGYVDDLRYAKSYIESAQASKSKKQIENALFCKGISKENIEQAYAECSDEGNTTDEEELIEKLLIKKHYDKQEATYDERMKIIRFLYRKGFSLDNIYKMVGYEE